MKNTLKMMTAVLALTVGAGAAQAKMAMPMTANSFVEKASVGNMFEIESSKLALQKSQDEGVKTFAQAMVDDHGAAGEKLATTLTKSKATEKPATVLDDKHKKMLDDLNAANGKDFDKLYVKDQVAAHKETIAVFSSYAKTGMDAPLKSFATTTLPTLQKHKMHIMALKKSESM